MEEAKGKKLIILGSGGYGNTVKDVAEQLGYEILAVLDDKDPAHPLSSFTSYVNPDTVFIPAFGNNEFRLSWCEKITSAGGQLATLVHNTAYVSPKAKLGPGVVILPHAIVNTGTTVSTGCIVNIGSIIDHDCVLEEGVHVAPGAVIKGENRISRATKIESGTIVEARSMSL